VFQYYQLYASFLLSSVTVVQFPNSPFMNLCYIRTTIQLLFNWRFFRNVLQVRPSPTNLWGLFMQDFYQTIYPCCSQPTAVVKALNELMVCELNTC